MKGNSYVLGVLIIYCGFLIWIGESIFDPAIRNRFVRVLMLLSAVFCVSLFTKEMVLLKAPLDFDAYAQRFVEYPPGTNIAGIPWSPHFTDLRVWVKNQTDADYENLYINIQPDRWNHAAAIVGESYGCHLTYMGGDSVLDDLDSGATRITVHKEQNGASATDNRGNELPHLIDRGGYRLECERLLAHDSIQVVFALAVPRKGTETPPMKLKKGEWGAALFGSKERISNILDDLGDRPTTSHVTIDGHYSLGPKPFVIKTKTIQVDDEN